jgi:hypothetical protein
LVEQTFLCRIGYKYKQNANVLKLHQQRKLTIVPYNVKLTILIQTQLRTFKIEDHISLADLFKPSDIPTLHMTITIFYVIFSLQSEAIEGNTCLLLFFKVGFQT